LGKPAKLTAGHLPGKHYYIQPGQCVKQEK